MPFSNVTNNTQAQTAFANASAGVGLGEPQGGLNKDDHALWVIAELLGGHSVQTGETGVTNALFPVGDPRRYGVTGAGDETTLLQNAIDSVATLGGGVVTIPEDFTVTVSVQSSNASRRALTARANVTIRGASRTTSVIKVAANGQPSALPQNSVIAYDYDANEDVGGFALEHLTIDQNAPNNPAPLVSPSYPHWILYIGHATSIIRCSEVDFLNISGVNSISVVGDVRSLTVRNCRFYANPNPSAAYFDSSVIYHHSTANAQNAVTRIQDNTFETYLDDISIGTLGAVGAGACIETHGGHQIITGNTAINFSAFANVTGISLDDPGSNGIVVSNNVAIGCRVGLQLYSQPYSGSTGALRNVTVTGNVFEVETDAWSTQGPGSLIYGRGILVNTTTNPVYGLVIANNVISYRAFTATGASGDSPGCGIYVSSTSTTPVHKMWRISGNLVDSPHSVGIYVQGNCKGCAVDGNEVRNAGQITAISNGFRTALLIQVLGSVCSVQGNVLYDDQATPTMKYMINTSGQSTTGHNLESFEVRDNVMWQFSDSGVTPVSPLFLDTNAGNARAPIITGAVHYWAAPAGNARYGSRVLDNKANIERVQVTSAEGTAWTVSSFDLFGSKTFDWPNLATATQQTTTVTVTGAVAGMGVVGVSQSTSLNGTRLWGEVTAADTVTVYQRNDTGGAIDVASGTLRVWVRKT